MAGSVIEIVPFDEAQGRAAAVAFDRYGKDFHANVAQRARHVRLKPRADDKHFIRGAANTWPDSTPRRSSLAPYPGT
jgi:hypothetical protein